MIVMGRTTLSIMEFSDNSSNTNYSQKNYTTITDSVKIITIGISVPVQKVPTAWLQLQMILAEENCSKKYDSYAKLHLPKYILSRSNGSRNVQQTSYQEMKQFSLLLFCTHCLNKVRMPTYYICISSNWILRRHYAIRIHCSFTLYFLINV